jgi:hypothetical protein
MGTATKENLKNNKEKQNREPNKLKTKFKKGEQKI